MHLISSPAFPGRWQMVKRLFRSRVFRIGGRSLREGCRMILGFWNGRRIDDDDDDGSREWFLLLLFFFCFMLVGGGGVTDSGWMDFDERERDREM